MRANVRKMEAAVITAVGIDVSKSKSTVAVRRPGGEIVLRPFEVHHTNSDLKKLASTLKKLGGDIRIVMEHTSTYWRPIALTLKEAGFFSVANAICGRIGASCPSSVCFSLISALRRRASLSFCVSAPRESLPAPDTPSARCPYRWSCHR